MKRSTEHTRNNAVEIVSGKKRKKEHSIFRQGHFGTEEIRT